MTLKVGQTYQTKKGQVRVLALDGGYNGDQNPIVVQFIDGSAKGSIMHLKKDGKYPGDASYEIIMPSATGYINVWPTKDEALAHKKFAGQVTVPVEYEVE